MKKQILAILWSLWFVPQATAGDPAIIVSPQWLNEHRNDPDLVILQVNFLKLDYEREHIAGARFLWPDWLAPDNPETGSLIVDKEYVLRALQSDTAVVVDARMKRFYDGDATGNPRDGHITGALNLPFPEMLDSTNAFKSAALLDANFRAVVPDKKKEIVLYCFIGQTACVDYIAGRLLGYRLRLYDASLQEWSRRDELPMEKTKE